MAGIGAPHTIWDFWAPRYDRLWVQRLSLGPSRRQVLTRIEQAAPGARRFLDLGCGIGQLAHEIVERRAAAEVLGVDPSEAMIARANSEYAHPRIRYLTGGIEVVPTGQLFDLITSTHSFPYLADGATAMARIRDLLVPGGRVLIVQANTETLWDGLVLRFVALTTTAANYRSAKKLTELMSQAGLRPSHLESIATAAFMPSIQLVEGVR